MLDVTITDPNHQQTFTGVDAPFWLGRNSSDQYPEMRLADPYVSRRHLEIAPISTDQVLVRCVGRSSIRIIGGPVLEPQTECVASLPLELELGRSQVTIKRVDAAVSVLPRPRLRTNAGQTMFVEDAELSGDHVPGALSLLSEVIPSERMITWFKHLLMLQESGSAIDALFDQACQMVVDLVGLDRCLVLTRSEKDWVVQSECGECQPNEMLFSRRVVDHAESHRQTVYDQTVGFTATGSLSSVSAFVASPILKPDGSVLGCLFGVRRVGSGLSVGLSGEGVKPIEAQLVQVIAGILSIRIARLAAEARQIRAQIQLEQFASPALVREMQSNPQWLEANQRELTLLFADIRGFSTLSERMQPHETFALVRDAMDCMTEAILKHHGYIFSFAGDGIAAMWNAPEATAAHARHAARAAIEIQATLPQAMQTWADSLGIVIQVGIGINTGPAIVGNSGSPRRLHYSPLGHHVNLASRVEGATKYFQVPILVTHSTQQQLDTEFPIRDLGEIVVVGTAGAVRVYELAAQANVDQELWRDYALALEHYHQGQSEQAKDLVDNLLQSHPDDGPARVLFERIAASPSGPTPLSFHSK